MVMYQWRGTRLTHGCVIHHSSNIIPSVILWGICCWFALPLGGIAGYTNSVISQDLTTNEEVLRLHALEQLRALHGAHLLPSITLADEREIHALQPEPILARLCHELCVLLLSATFEAVLECARIRLRA